MEENMGRIFQSQCGNIHPWPFVSSSARRQVTGDPLERRNTLAPVHSSGAMPVKVVRFLMDFPEDTSEGKRGGDGARPPRRLMKNKPLEKPKAATPAAEATSDVSNESERWIESGFDVEPQEELGAAGLDAEPQSETLWRLSKKTNINIANEVELRRVPGISEKLAANILKETGRHREIVTKMQLMQIPGIGKKRCEALLEQFSVPEEFWPRS